MNRSEKLPCAMQTIFHNYVAAFFAGISRSARAVKVTPSLSPQVACLLVVAARRGWKFSRARRRGAVQINAISIRSGS
jgi:hypothetical protein